jgi:hypothetical protein
MPMCQRSVPHPGVVPIPHARGAGPELGNPVSMPPVPFQVSDGYPGAIRCRTPLHTSEPLVAQTLSRGRSVDPSIRRGDAPTASGGTAASRHPWTE